MRAGRKVRGPAVAVVAVLVAGCTMGRGDAPRWQAPPAGIRLHLEFDSDVLEKTLGVSDISNAIVRGEALSVQEDGLLLWVELATSGLTWTDQSRVLLLDRTILERARIREQGDRVSRQGRSLDASDPADMNYIARWARYPRPLTEEQLSAFLEGIGEPAVVRVSLPDGSGAGEGAADRPTPPRATAAGTAISETRGDFLARTRAATQRFRDRRVAVREGYRRLGPDFPGMGEHWVHPGMAVAGTVVAERPPVLSYLSVDGRAVLTGVAWTVPLAPGQSPPPSPLGDSVWHDHSGTLDEEALLLDSPRSHQHADGQDPDAPRLSMVHAWLWAPNPHGMLAQNNWSLPYLKTGLQPPEAVDPAVARALSLGGSGRDYYRTLLVRASGATGADRAIIEELVVAASGDVDRLVRSVHDMADTDPAGPVPLPESICARIGAVWQSLWTSLETELSEAAWERLRPAALRWQEGDASPSMGHHG